MFCKLYNSIISVLSVMKNYAVETCLALTLGLFVPLNIFILNNSEIKFSMSSVLLWFIIVSFVSFTVLFMISFALNRFFPRAAIIFKLLASGLLLGFFLQAYFINPDYGVLNGQNINWDNYFNYGIINIIIWVCCLIVPFVLRYFKKQEVFVLLRNASIIIAFCQIVQVAYNYYRTDIKGETQYAMSEEHMFEVSQNKNIIVFILDTFQADFFENICKKYPGFSSKFCDFVYYNDTTSMYRTTSNALPLILTGKPFYNDMTWDKHLASNWKDNNFYNILLKNGFDINIFTKGIFMHENAKNVSNLYTGYYKIKSGRNFIRDFYTVSFFVTMPHFLKKHFVIYTEQINDNSRFIEKNSAKTSFYYINDGKFFNNLNNKRLTINKNKNKFILYHLNGAHPPYKLNAKSQFAKRSTREEQCLGALNIVLRYIQLLKENNVYDKTTMIIMADHGNHVQPHSRTLFLVKPESRRKDSLEIFEDALSYEDIHALFLSFSGLSMETFNGKENIFHRKRRFFYDYLWDIDDTKSDFFEYLITGNAADGNSWSQTGKIFRSYGKNDNEYVLGTDVFPTKAEKVTFAKYRCTGWYFSEENHTWNDGTSSELEFSVEHGAKKDLLLSVDLVPFIKKGNAAQQVTVLANGTKVDLWNIRTGGVYAALIPAFVMETDKLHLRFVITSPGRPGNEKTGIGDQRLLGIAVKRLSIDLADKGTVKPSTQEAKAPDFSKVPYCELGKALSFGEKDAAVNARHKISGWSFQEPWGTWTEGKNAELAFRIREGAGKKLTLKLKGRPFLKNGLASQRVAVFANDVPIAEWSMSRGGVFTAEIPAASMTSDLLRLRYVIADPTRPCENGKNGDIRELGMGVSELTLGEGGVQGASAAKGTVKPSTQEAKAPDFSKVPYCELGKALSFGEKDAAVNARYKISGWSFQEPWGTWTEGKNAELAFRIREGAGKKLTLELNGHPFLKTGLASQRVAVFANDVPIAEWNMPRGGVFTAEIPAASMTSDLLRLRFVIADPSSPSASGINDDIRELGLGVSELTLREGDVQGASAAKGTVKPATQETKAPDFSKVPYCELGKALSFGEKDAAVNARHKISGWSFQEPWGTWTEGKNAELAFRIREGAGKKLTLELNGHPFLKTGLAVQRVAVFANDVPIAEWNMPRGGVFTAEIPAASMTSDLLRLRFVIADPSSPSASGINGDIRELGLGVSELTLREGSVQGASAAKGTVKPATQETKAPDFSKVPYCELGKALSFGEKDAAVNARHKISGWSFQEPWGTWTEGKNAELAFRIREGAGKKLILELNGHPFLKTGLASQRVAVFANDVPIAEWNMPRGGVFTAEIPAASMTSDLLRLRFVIADPSSPSASGINDDIRELGMGVSELTLRAE